MQYMLLIYMSQSTTDWDALSHDEQEQVLREYHALSDAAGVVGSGQLQPVETATTVRVQERESLITDGPFAATKEVLGGYYLVDVEDIDAALELAARIPAARMGGAIEVRPVVER